MEVAWLSWCQRNSHSLLAHPVANKWWWFSHLSKNKPCREWWWSNLSHKCRLLKSAGLLEMLPLCMLLTIHMASRPKKVTTLITRSDTLIATVLRKSWNRWQRLSTMVDQPCSVVREHALRAALVVKWCAALTTTISTTLTTGSEPKTQLLQLHLQLRIYEELIRQQTLQPLITKVTYSK